MVTDYDDPKNPYNKPIAPVAEPPPPKKHGCFFWGCIISLIVFVIGAIAISLAVYFGINYLKGRIIEYTDTAPVKLPEVSLPPQQMAELNEKVEKFKKDAEAGKETEPLILTADDLNALLEENEEMKGRVFISIDGDKLKGQISIPLTFLQGLGVGDRFLNGKGTFKASLQSGILVVTAEEIEVKGKPLPDEFMQNLRQQNLAKDAYNNPKNRAVLEKFDSIEVKDGKIILKAHAKPASDSPDAKADEKASATEKTDAAKPDEKASQPEKADDKAPTKPGDETPPAEAKPDATPPPAEATKEAPKR